MAVYSRTTLQGKAGATLRDRYAELLVIVVVIVALVVAWGVKAGAEARAVHIAVGAFRASYAHNWIRQEAAAPTLLAISDPSSGSRFHTTIAVQQLDSVGTGEQAARALNQARLQDKELFRFLSGETIQWRGRDTYRNQFAYVHVSPDLLDPQLPVVLHGVDYVFQHGAVTYVITLLADENVYDDALVAFERFLESVTPG